IDRPDPRALLMEMARVSKKYVMIFIRNKFNYGFQVHRFHHHVTGEPWNHGRIDLMSPEPWRLMFTEMGLRVRSTIWLDCPWWPDIIDFGKLIGDFMPPLKRPARRIKPENRYRWEGHELPYYNPELDPKFHRRMARLAWIENSGLDWFKKRFAHN